MKFLGSLFTFAVLGICSVFAEPDINQHVGNLHYWISTTTMKATVMGVKTSGVYEVTIPSYITVEGRRYYINQIGPGAFSNSDVQRINVPSDVQSLNISYNAFFDAKNIRNIKLDTEKVTADNGAFTNIGTLVGFEGVGARSLANDMAKKLLQSWGLPVGKDFTNVSSNEFNRALYTLAYYVKKNFGVYDKIAYKDNAVSVLAIGAGGSNGIARVYRILAKNMGFQYNDVHVGSDTGYYSWNYVYINKTGTYKQWYNLDIVNTNFPSTQYNSSVFRTKAQQRSVLRSKYGSGAEQYLNTDNWIIFNNEYNYPGEFIYVQGQKYYFDSPRTETFYGWCVRNRSGAIA